LILNVKLLKHKLLIINKIQFDKIRLNRRNTYEKY